MHKSGAEASRGLIRCGNPASYGSKSHQLLNALALTGFCQMTALPLKLRFVTGLAEDHAFAHDATVWRMFLETYRLVSVRRQSLSS